MNSPKEAFCFIEIFILPRTLPHSLRIEGFMDLIRQSRISIIIQARTGSTRLPQKMTRIFFDGKTVLDIILDRLIQNCPLRIIVATTHNKSDRAIIEIAERAGVEWYAGDENNVVNRFLEASKNFGVDKIIRVCADNPFLDFSAINQLAAGFIRSEADYWAFFMPDGTPSIRTHFGFWAEGVTRDALTRIESATNEMFYKEHVTPYIYQNPSLFKIYSQPIPHQVAKQTDIRLTLDTENDFFSLQKVYSDLIVTGLPIDQYRVLDYLNANPEMRSRMAAEIKSNTK